MEYEEGFPRIFKKAIKGAVGGTHINTRNEIEDFLLKGDPATTDIELITVEVHDKEAEKYFLRHNKAAITKGYLVEISDGYEITIDEVNAVSDGYLKDLLKVPYKKMVKRVNEFTSPVPVERLLVFAVEENKPVGTVDFLRSVVAKFAPKGVPSTANFDDVKVGSTT